jgi:acetoin utilization deacetylase AcuC-like enzyme
MIDRNNLINKLSPIPARLATLEEVELCHSPDYIDRVMDTAGEELRYLDPDTVTSEDSCKVAFLAAGSSIEAVNRVVSADIENAFALIRPPGHHAERNRQMGFCIFNNPALAAAYALRFLGLTRILIVDWDVHHCNGTQHIFESTDEVLVFSTHRSPFFPGTGTLDKIGKGKGLGYSINVPLTPLKSDRDFIEIYREILFPVALEYKPQLILLSAGFDIHYDDPIGGMKVTESGFAYLTSIILEIADSVCGGKVVAILEGGYDLGALRKSVKAVLETLCGEFNEAVKSDIDAKSPDPSTVEIIQEVKNNYKKFWGSLNNA